jgi:hypothetical protein
MEHRHSQCGSDPSSHDKEIPAMRPFTKYILAPVMIMALIFGCSRPQQAGKGKDSTATAASRDSLSVELPRDLQRSDDKVSFVYQLKQGDMFGYSILVKEAVKVRRDTMDESNHQDIRYRYKFRVLEVGQDGAVRMEATCLRVTFTGEYLSAGSKRSMNFDSDEKNEPQKLQMFSRWNAPVNTPYEFTLSKFGVIESVDVTESILKRLMGNDYNTSKQKSRDMIRKDYDENGLKNILQLAFQRFDDRPIAVDSFWTQSWSGQLGFLKLQHTAYYTYKGFQPSRDGNIAHIAIRMQSRYVGSEKLDTGQGIATIGGFDVKGKGVTVFHHGEGRCASRRFNQSVFVKFFVEIPKELKEATQGQMKDFWLTENATVENVIEPLAL